MSNELTIKGSFVFKKGGAEVRRSFSKSITVDGDAFTHQIQTIAATEEVLAEGTDLGTPGWLLVINLDTSYYVDVGLTGSFPARLEPGEFSLYRCGASGAAIYAKAETAQTVNVEYILIED